MTKHPKSNQHNAPVAPDKQHGPELRIDAAHPVQASPAMEALAAEPVLQSVAAGTAQQAGDAAAIRAKADDMQWVVELSRMRNQGRQLADHLRAWQTEIEHRTEQLNARESAFEQRLRGTELWWREKQVEFTDLQASVADRQRSVSEREQQHAAVVVRQEMERVRIAEGQQRQHGELLARHAELQEQQGCLEVQQQALEQAQLLLENQRGEWETQRRQELQRIDQRRAASLQMIRLALAGLEERRNAVLSAADKPGEHASGGAVAKGSKSEANYVGGQFEKRLAAEFAEQKRVLEQARDQLIQSREEVVRYRQDLFLERERMEAEMRAERLRLSQRQHALDEELRQERQRITELRKQLEYRETALGRLAEELSLGQRECLVHRLAADETLLKLTAEAHQGIVEHTVASTRQRIQELFRADEASIAKSREELDAAREQVAAQLNGLQQKKLELESWMATRLDDQKQQAARIAALEEQLQSRTARLLEQESKAREERIQSQKELAVLKAELAICQANSPHAGRVTTKPARAAS